MKKIFTAILASCLALTTFASCSKSDDKFVVSTNATFYPYEYIGKDNKVVGVDIDIAQAIADEAGKTLKVDNVEFNSALTAVSTGNADASLAGITVDEKRKKTLDFSEPYATSVQYIIVKEDSKLKTIEDLADLKIGVQNGTTSQLILEDEIKEGVLKGTKTKVEPYKSALLATMDLKTDTIDAVVVDELPAKNIVKENKGTKCFELTFADGSSTKEEYAVAVKKGDKETLELVNKVIKKLKEDGKIDEYLLNHMNGKN